MAEIGRKPPAAFTRKKVRVDLIGVSVFDLTASFADRFLGSSLHGIYTHWFHVSFLPLNHLVKG